MKIAQKNVLEFFLFKKKQISTRSKIQTHVLLNPFKSNQLGRPPVLSEEIEKLLVDALIKLADWDTDLLKYKLNKSFKIIQSVPIKICLKMVFLEGASLEVFLEDRTILFYVDYQEIYL